jgi:hypothetical protein
MCCHYGVFKVRADFSAEKTAPAGRSLKTQQRVSVACDADRSGYVGFAGVTAPAFAEVDVRSRRARDRTAGTKLLPSTGERLPE